jgi:hypothetical protein
MMIGWLKASIWPVQIPRKADANSASLANAEKAGAAAKASAIAAILVKRMGVTPTKIKS